MRKKRLLLAILPVLVTIAVVTPANGQQRQHQWKGKLSSLVRRAVAEATPASPQATRAYRQSWLHAFVRLSDVDAARQLGDYQCHVIDRSEDICIVALPISRVRSLAESDLVTRIEAGCPCRVQMDTTATIVQAKPVYEGQLLPQPFTGKGVVVGVMDIGFDLTHPNFRDADGARSRIGAFWDQLDTDTIGSKLPVGRDYVGLESVAFLQHSRDGLIATHGTHTLGIAAGSGFTSPYRGMAFESDICIVANAVSDDLPLIDSTDIYKYTTATDALGFKYIFDYAEREGKPCVISFSEGYYDLAGTEDSLYSEYLSRLVGPGRIIVASAGNQSGRYTYLEKPCGQAEAGCYVVGGASRSVQFALKSDSPFVMRLIAEEGAADTLALQLAPSLRDSVLADTMCLSASQRWAVTVQCYPSAYNPAEWIYMVGIEGNDDWWNMGRLALALSESSGSVSAQCASFSAAFYNDRDGGWHDAEDSHNILAPGAFPAVIAVGSTIHRTGFVNYLGEYCDYSQIGRNDGVRAVYSSQGPSWNGQFKPDVVAPGNNIISSYSSFYLEHNPSASDIRSDVEHFEWKGRTYAWNANTGTSMAAPVVAGAIALWLEAKPDLTPDDVKGILRKIARHPEEQLGYPNNAYGYGEIDVYRGLLTLLGVDAINGVELFAPSRVSVLAKSPTVLQLYFKQQLTGNLKIDIYNMSGACVYSDVLSPLPSQSVQVAIPFLPMGIYAVRTAGCDRGTSGVSLVRVP